MSRVHKIDGLPVLNAKRPLTLIVTARDCSGGDPKRPNTCAAAKAIVRSQHGLECRVHVGRVYIRANKGNWLRYATSNPLAREIVAFDRGGRFAPGEYQLNVPPKSKAGGQGSTKSKNRPKHLQKPRAKMHITVDVRNGPVGGEK